MKEKFSSFWRGIVTLAQTVRALSIWVVFAFAWFITGIVITVKGMFTVMSLVSDDKKHLDEAIEFLEKCESKLFDW